MSEAIRGSQTPATHTVVGGSDGTLAHPLKTDANGSLTIVNPDGTNVAGGGTPDYQATPGSPVPTKAVMIAGSDGTNARRVATDSSGVLKVDVAGQDITVAVSAASLPLPATASTAAKQDTANTSLASVDGKLPTLVSGRVPVDPSGVTSPVSGTVTANLGTAGTGATSVGKAEDAAHASGDVGVMMLGVRNDALAAFSGTDLDYTPIAVSDSGRINVGVAPAAARVQGTATATGTTSTSVIGAGAGSLRNYITDIQVSNTGASTTLITLQDGNGGTALLYTIAPAGGGSNIHLASPIRTTAATALYFACGTASTTVYISAQGYVAP